MNAKRWIVAALSAACLAVSAGEPAEKSTLDKLLRAVEANDYESFIADGNDVFQATLTKQMLAGVSGQLAPGLKAGYSATYLGELSQQRCRVLLWKLAYKDGRDDTLAKLVLRDGKVAGFWLQ